MIMAANHNQIILQPGIPHLSGKHATNEALATVMDDAAKDDARSMASVVCIQCVFSLYFYETK